MKKYTVTDGAVETEAQARGVDINAFGESDEGPEPTDASHVAEEPVKFDTSTTAWNVPSGEGFLCHFYSGDTDPLRTTLPMSTESLDEFADE
jgi:hypothetical protein